MANNGQPGNDRLRREFDQARENARGRPRRGRARPFELAGAFTQQEGQEVIETLYVRDELMVRASDEPAVTGALTDLQVEHTVHETQLAGLRRVVVSGDAYEVLRRLRDRGVDAAQLNHVLDAQAFPRMCPADEPVPAGGPATFQLVPPASSLGTARVAVIDTGSVQSVVAQHARLAGVTGQADDQANLSPYGSHGVFVAGVLRGVCPGAEVWISDIVLGGVVSEAEMVADIEAALNDGRSIISMSAGLYVEAGGRSLAWELFDEDIRPRFPGAVFISAAGNDATNDEFYPARYGWAVGVGASTPDGLTRSSYSNFGDNVDVWATGDDHVNAFVRGSYRMLDGSQTPFPGGLAKWSGTSFATPLVAGMVARRVIEYGETPPVALSAVLAGAPHAIDGKPALII